METRGHVVGGQNMLQHAQHLRERLADRGIAVYKPTPAQNGQWRLEFEAVSRRLSLAEIKGAVEVFVIWAYRAKVDGWFQTRAGDKTYCLFTPTSPLSEVFKGSDNETK